MRFSLDVVDVGAYSRTILVLCMDGAIHAYSPVRSTTLLGFVVLTMCFVDIYFH